MRGLKAIPTEPRSRGLWAYNIRILLGNSYWLIITPIVVAQLVLFWSIATSGLSSAPGAAQTIEILAPILGALLCAYAVSPEHAGVGELVFVRPISLEKLLLLRLAAIFAFVLVLLIPPLVIFRLTVTDFAVLPALLSGLVSALFLSALAMALASATRQPLLGLGVAGAFWAFDFLLGAQFNPLLTLHTYAGYLGGAPMSELWLYGKAVLLVLAAALYLWNRQLLGRPAAPRRVLVIVRNVVLVVAILVAYLYTGAAGKLVYLLRNEANLGNQAWISYQQAFRVYGPLPVPWLFGPAFPLYLQAELGRTPPLLTSAAQSAQVRKRMALVVEKHPRSLWADNAAFELARARSHAPAPQFLTILRYQAGQEPTQEVVESDESGMAEALLAFAQHYPRSPFAPIALAQRAQVGGRLLDFDLTVDSYRRLVADYPTSEQSAKAGLTLAGLYLNEGRYDAVLAAAKVAAQTAPWDQKPTALLRAAFAAQQAGNATLAREYYQRARDETEVTRQRAGERAHGGKTKQSPAQIIAACTDVAEQARRALSGSLAPVSQLPQGRATVVGRLTRDGAGVPGARVIIGVPGLFPSANVAQATTRRDGSFEVVGLAPGSYATLAFALPDWFKTWEIGGLKLPVQVTGPRTILPPLSLVRQTVKPTLTPPPPPPPALGFPVRSSNGGRGGGGQMRNGEPGRGRGGGGRRGGPQ